MKKFSLILSCVLFAVFIISCEKNDLENETEIEFKSIDKGDVETPGNQYSGPPIDKGDVETPGGQ